MNQEHQMRQRRRRAKNVVTAYFAFGSCCSCLLPIRSDAFTPSLSPLWLGQRYYCTGVSTIGNVKFEALSDCCLVVSKTVFRKRIKHSRQESFSSDTIAITALTSTTSPQLPSEEVTRKRTELSMGDSKKQKILDNNSKNINWTSATLALAIPAWIGMMADPLLSLIDTAFVGRLGPMELAALGPCTSIFHLAFSSFRATTTATTSLVAGSSSSPEEQRRVTLLSLLLGLGLGFSVLRILQVSGPWALACMGIPSPAARGRASRSGTRMLYTAAHDYLSTRLFAAPAVLWIVVAEGAFRGYGDTKIPLLASLVASGINLLLDPILMFGAVGWGIMGAAAATALSQVGAAMIYGFFLWKRNMLPPVLSWRKRIFRKRGTEAASPFSNGASVKAASDVIAIKVSSSKDDAVIPKSAAVPRKTTWQIIRTILGANLAMCIKQGSLLLGWAYATSKATRLGSAHVAAHQVALSFWLVFALWLDGAAVAAQVLMSQIFTAKTIPESKPPSKTKPNDGSDVQYSRTTKLARMTSLTHYMMKVATAQGVLSTIVIMGLGLFVPRIFTQDPTIRFHLQSLMPDLAFQQLLISWTLVMEYLVVGTNQFGLLAVGNIVSSILCAWLIQHATSVQQIWSRGIIALFLGRLCTALLGIVRAHEWNPTVVFSTFAHRVRKTKQGAS